MVNITKIVVKDLKENKELLEKMYSLVLKDYYEVEESKYPIENYISNISANDNQKIIYYIERETEIICYLELEKVNLSEYYVSVLTTSKPYRGKGFAKFLLSELIMELNREKESYKIKIFVNST